ncbi:hypothetical protein AYO38_02155 [bacterium SCGC AG-212-C10]|nr:hypothetical protein AYO38_02155 [bacterium SCGC AG-212-C10]
MEPSASKDFATAIAGADTEVDLFGAAIVIASLGNREVDAHACARYFDTVADDVLGQVTPAGGPEALAGAIDHELFVVRGFHGNAGEYNDPANSYLDQVISRRTGIPIALSLVYMEVAQRVGLRCDGIGYPGHFIVRCGDPDDPIFVDPYHQGARLDHEELLAGLRGRNLGGATPESFLSAVTRRQILQRMLNNLRIVFSERQDMQSWLDAVELALMLEPWNADLIGERGMLRFRLGDPEHALEDLERYVAAGSGAPRHDAAVRILDQLRLQYGGGEDIR